MDTDTAPLSQIAATSKQIIRRAFTIGGNRLELLLVELQEERERLVLAILLGLGVVAFGMLAGITLTAAIVVMLWNYSPVIALVSLTLLYSLTALFCFLRLRSLKQNWQTLPSTLDQLRKDRECLNKTIN